MIIIYFLRSLVFNIIAYSSVSLAYVLGILVSKISTKATFNSAKRYCAFVHYMLYKIVGVKLEIRGAEKVAHLSNKACIIASSHQSIWETMFVYNKLFSDPRYVLKKEIVQTTMLGKTIENHVGIAIDRKKIKQSSFVILNKSKELFENNSQLIIFPEGTRVKPGKSIKWKKSFAKIYEEHKVPIVPVALNSGYIWPKQSFLKFPGKLIVEFLDPIEPGLNQTQIMEKVPRLVQEKSIALANEGACKYIKNKYLKATK